MKKVISLLVLMMCFTVGYSQNLDGVVADTIYLSCLGIDLSPLGTSIKRSPANSMLTMICVDNKLLFDSNDMQGVISISNDGCVLFSQRVNYGDSELWLPFLPVGLYRVDYETAELHYRGYLNVSSIADE